ncbi:MAG: redoxin domain-containing protein [Solirubrobacteraceae bacterium]
MSDGERWISRLVGTTLPNATLRCSDGTDIALSELAADPLLLCFYPGDEDGPRASKTPTSCEVQRSGLRDYALDFAAFGVRVAGVSSEAHELQALRARGEQLPFPLLSDDGCALADALGLPTFDDLGTRRYRRTSLVAERGAVAAVFYPVSPRRAAVQALAWLERSGIR